jgi:serine/threonine-protein kinase
MIGESVGAYNIVSELGRGGMGIVYLAEHRHLGRRAAIKFLLREFTEKQELLHRFFTEARAASLVDHDGIVRVLDCDIHASGHAYIVMEYLEGQTLRAYLAARGPLPYPEAAAIVLKVAGALAAAHAKGIVHRDLKPDNIFALSNPVGEVKIVDFGIAKLTTTVPTDQTKTLAGALMGTPLYMSPEQARGAGTVDARADVYSLGCILFELLTGRPPFLRNATGELIAAHLAESPPPLETTLPLALRLLVESMLAKAPDDRPSLRDKVIPILQVVTTGRTAGFPALTTAADAVLTPRGTNAAPPPVSGSEAVTPPAAGDRLPRTLDGTAWRYLVPFAAVAATVVAIGLWRRGGGQEEPALEIPEVVVPRPVVVQESPPPPPPAPTEVPPPPKALESSPSPSPSLASTERTRTRVSVRAAASRLAGKVAGVSPAERLVRVELVTEPPGSFVCVPSSAARVGVTNGTIEVRRDDSNPTLLLYQPGYHIERIDIAGDGSISRTVRLRRLSGDDLQPPPPCR